MLSSVQYRVPSGQSSCPGVQVQERRSQRRRPGVVQRTLCTTAHEPKNPGGQGALDLRGTVRRNSDGAGGTAGVGVGFALESS